MTIDSLVTIVAPPKRPLDADGEWQCAETIIGISFPPDFRDLITRYGSGEFFEGFLRVYNPLTLPGLACIKRDQKTYGERLGALTPPFALQGYPVSHELFPWGRDDNGNGYFWLTKGKPDKWPIVYLRHGYEGEPIQLRHNVTTFLEAYCTNQIAVFANLHEPFTRQRCVFTPGRSQSEVATKLLKRRR